MEQKKKKAIVYPYDIQFAPVVRYSHFIENYDIAGIAAPLSSGCCGKDAGKADCGDDIGITVSEDFSEALENCEAVIFARTEREGSYTEDLYPKMKEAASAGKDIIVAFNLNRDNYNQVKALCDENKVTFGYFHNEEWFNMPFEPPYLSAHKLYTLETPVVFVLGEGEKCNKFETQLALREYFTSQGYKVGQIGSRKYCELMGFHSMPDFMFEARHEMEKIYLFNKLVKSIEVVEKSDVIIIGVPGGVASMNAKNAGYCGITAYEIANAVTPDAAVFCMYYALWDNKYYDEMKNIAKYKLGLEVQNFVVSCSRVDWSGAAETMNHIDFFTISGGKVEAYKNEKRNEGLPIYNVVNMDDAKKLGESVEDILAGYAEIEHY